MTPSHIYDLARLADDHVRAWGGGFLEEQLMAFSRHMKKEEERELEKKRDEEFIAYHLEKTLAAEEAKTFRVKQGQVEREHTNNCSEELRMMSRIISEHIEHFERSREPSRSTAGDPDDPRVRGAQAGPLEVPGEVGHRPLLVRWCCGGDHGRGPLSRSDRH